MTLGQLSTRLHGYYQRQAVAHLYRRPFVVNSPRAVISFTFDDFPRSALFTGGRILNRFGAVATYYASLGLVDTVGATGQIFTLSDLARVQDDGHELGCHTFSHCHSWNTTSSRFERDILANSAALKRILPDAELRTLSYPISHPRPYTKARVSRHFLCCRGGGQTFNRGTTDLNYLSAFFLEKTRGDFNEVRIVIERNREARGWLIIATHDVADNPTPFGCTPQFFEHVVRYAHASGACLLPVARAFEALRTGTVPE